MSSHSGHLPNREITGWSILGWLAEKGSKDEEGAWGPEIDRIRELLEYYRKEEEKGKLLHQQLTVAIGTIGSIAFAGLVLVLQNPRPFVYKSSIFLTPHQSFDLLILTLAMTSILALFSVMATSFAGSGIVRGTGSVGTFGFVTGMFSIMGMIFGIIQLIEDFSTPTFMILSVFILILFAIFVAVGRRSGKEGEPLPFS